MLLLVLLSNTAKSAQQRTTVALDLTRLNDRQYSALDGLALEQRLVLRLVEEGFAVVAPSAQAPSHGRRPQTAPTPTPEILVRVEVHGDVIVLEAERARHTERREINWDRQVELELLHLELSHKAVELVRSVQSRPITTAESASSEARRAPPTAPRAMQPASTSELEPASVTAGVEIGGVWRPPALDPMARLGLRLRLGGPWRGELGVAAVSASEPGIRVIEIEPEVGIALELKLRERWALSAGLRLGPLLHTYSLDAGGAEQGSGSSVDGYAASPLRVALRLFGPVELDWTIAPGIATRGRRHILDGKTLWQRSPGRIEATLGVAVAL